DTGVIKILADLPEHVLLARLLEIRADDRLGIGIGLLGIEPHLLRSPLAEQLVAAGDRLEPQFLVMRELVLERLFAPIERAHEPVSYLTPARRPGLPGPPTIHLRRIARR